MITIDFDTFGSLFIGYYTEATTRVCSLIFFYLYFLYLQLHTRILKEHQMTTIQIIQLSVICFIIRTHITLWNIMLNVLSFYLQVFIGGTDPNVTIEHLKQVFSQYGQLVHLKIPVGKWCGFVQLAERYVTRAKFDLWRRIHYFVLINILCVYMWKLCWGSINNATRNLVWRTNCETFMGS